MIDFPRWKYALVAVVMLLGMLYALPNVFVPLSAVQIAATHSAPVDAALEGKIESVLKKQHIAYRSITLKHDKSKGDHILVGFANGDLQKSAAAALKPVLGAAYIVAFNLASTVPHWLRAIGARAMPLGLDLQGGVHFLMRVDQKEVVDKQTLRYTQDIAVLLHAKHIRYTSVTRARDSGQGVLVMLPTTADRERAARVLENNFTNLNITSMTRGFALRATVKPEKLRKLAQDTIKENLATLRNRINALGVSEPVIQAQGDNQIVVELAGVQDPTEAKRVIGAVATLEYVAGLGGPGDPATQEAVRTGNIPPNAHLYYGRHGEPYLVSKRVIVSGDELVDASSGVDPNNGTSSVNVSLNATGARKMLDFTRDNVGKPMAVVYVERVTHTSVVAGKEVQTPKISYRVINYATIQGVFGSRFQTNGLGSPKQASELALLLKGGALAAPMDIVGQSVIGPSMGKQNIKKGLDAVLLGLALVLLCAAIYYRLFGLVADIALFFNLVILVAVMSMVGVTLTMPGIAGIVLTLGMAIDANVLICERIREELRNGSTPLASIRAGYEKAWATILDANVTHLIAALALTTLGSGAIRGFGVTLLIGILTSLFTSVTMTHAITALLHGRGRKLKTLSV